MSSATEPGLILFAGLAGTGKSTLAYELAQRITRCSLLRKDIVTEQLMLAGDGHSDASWRSFEVIFALAEDLLSQQVTVILDLASLQPFVYERVSLMCRHMHTSLHVVQCQINAEERLSRVLSRKHMLSHIKAGDYHDQASIFTNLPASRMIVDTSLPLEECLNDILKFISYDRHAPFEKNPGVLAISELHGSYGTC